ncbi:hypothetical protein RRG08_058724 [Elysia crispata]|uniref:Uncharacterized protein n=1 Tax=Elysia crispata TaxID=231223 RepID=A0AAE0YWG6_9GAST|nr:hypothetical protein RRG08_058724 [Elysia crispata]
MFDGCYKVKSSDLDHEVGLSWASSGGKANLSDTETGSGHVEMTVCCFVKRCVMRGLASQRVKGGTGDLTWD